MSFYRILMLVRSFFRIFSKFYDFENFGSVLCLFTAKNEGRTIHGVFCPNRVFLHQKASISRVNRQSIISKLQNLKSIRKILKNDGTSVKIG